VTPARTAAPIARVPASRSGGVVPPGPEDSAGGPWPADESSAATALERRSALQRTAGVGLAVLAALPFSLAALASDFRYSAALGELVLVPLCALAVALVAAWRHPWVAQLRPGRADWAVAGLCGLASAGLLALGPVVAGNVYYALRPDLLAVPLVATAAMSLLFGVRALVAFGLPVLLSLLTWPLPLRALLEPVAEGLTSLTGAAVALALHVLPLATPVPGPGDLRLTIDGPGAAFDVVVASACSGIAGITGMLLVGLAAQYVLHGRRRARLVWLASAVVLAWVLNLARILLLLGTGRLFGERFALDVVHPVAGLLLLNVAFALLVAAAPRYGLRFSLTSPVPADTPLTAPVAPRLRLRGPALRRRVAAVAAGAALLAALDAEVPGTAAAYDASDPAAVAFADAPSGLPQFAVTVGDEKLWARRYFGAESSWVRHRLQPRSASTGWSLWLDSITTDDWAALRAHPLLDCYRFHGFEVVSVSRPTLAAGLLADQVVYRRPDGATWHVLAWEWPVRSEGGLRHERVVLLASSERTDLAPPSTVESDDTGSAPTSGWGLRSLLAGALAGGGTAEDPNPALSEALRRAADDVVASHLLTGSAS
jgi:exosortase/archaeosortase family protein